jgi:hypothetical protein
MISLQSTDSFSMHTIPATSSSLPRFTLPRNSNSSSPAAVVFSHVPQHSFTYNETYGYAFPLGSTSDFIYEYPEGTSSLKPSLIPWRASILIMTLFIVFSVVIIGHCSDLADAQKEEEADEDNNNDDQAAAAAAAAEEEEFDDEYILEQRWCGNSDLKAIWTGSLIVSLIATAYGSIIGYVRFRDYVVANCRSQTPGVTLRSDYYFIDDDNSSSNAQYNGTTQQQRHEKRAEQRERNEEELYEQLQEQQQGHKQKAFSHYQASGEPRFKGNSIRWPSQAASHVNTR